MNLLGLFKRNPPQRFQKPPVKSSALAALPCDRGERGLPVSPLARNAGMTWAPSGREELSMPWGADPLLLFPFLRYLRDHIPDVSAGVWAWVRLCTTPQHVEYMDGTDVEIEEAREIVRNLDMRLFEFGHMKHQGMDALVNAFFLSVFTYGAFAGEVALRPDRKGLDRFYFIDPATIRFRRAPKSRELEPWQILSDGKEIRLNPSSFFYYGLDTDNDSPYGRSPLLALPFVVRIQQQLIEDMNRAMHNAGWPTIHVVYRPRERAEGESVSEYHASIESEFNAIKDAIPEKKADSNYITHDNVEFRYLSPGTGSEQRWNLSLQAISEQVISALHLAPFMIGRNWGTTETWGTAQYRLITGNAVSVQRGAKRMCEWLRNLELALQGSRVTTRHHFEAHRALSLLDAARSRSLDFQTALRLKESGIIDDERVRRMVEEWL